jgi:hypothetical protein
MKKQLFPIHVLIAFVFFIIAGCNKGSDLDITPAPLTKTEMLSTGTWKFTVAYSGGVDVTAFLPACQKDNILTFVTDGTGNVNEGLTKCNSGDPQTNPITWTFNTGETTVTISSTLFTGGSNLNTIVALTDVSLALSQTITISGTPQTVILNFVH